MSARASIMIPKDCGMHYYGDEVDLGLFCPACGLKLKDEPYIAHAFRGKGFRADFCVTYDSVYLVSKKVKEFFKKERVCGVSFFNVSPEMGIYLMDVSREVKLDTGAIGTSFGRYCERCGRYSEIVGFRPPIMASSELVEESQIFRTDVKFGCGRDQNYLLVVGEKLKDKIQSNFPSDVYFVDFVTA